MFCCLITRVIPVAITNNSTMLATIFLIIKTSLEYGDILEGELLYCKYVAICDIILHHGRRDAATLAESTQK
jgi:hypothetical protein